MSYKISDTNSEYNVEVIKDNGLPLMAFYPGSVHINEFGVINEATGKAREWLNVPLEMGALSYGMLSGLMTYSTGALGHVEKGLHLYPTMEEAQELLLATDVGYINANYAGMYLEFFTKARLIPEIGWRALSIIDGMFVAGKLHTASTWYEGQSDRERWSNNVFYKHTGLDLALSGKPVKLNWFSKDEKKAALFGRFEAMAAMTIEDRRLALQGVAAKGKFNQTVKAVTKKVEGGEMPEQLVETVKLHGGGTVTVADLIENGSEVDFFMGDTEVPGASTVINSDNVVVFLEVVRARGLTIAVK